MTDTLPTIDPRHAALLLMDYQVGILGRLENAEALLTRAVDAISLIRGAGGQVGYVRVAFKDADYEGVPAASRMASTLARVGGHSMPTFRQPPSTSG
jgi:nicotinamidase-related amidase